VPVLSLTEQAARKIQELLGAADLPDTAGLRLAQREDHPALAMTLVESAGPHDVVLHDGDATVFLGPAAAERVAEQVLDARITETGSAFYLRD
jgi:Fe-S cluster assembly iron-binding protein IscA